MSDILFFNTEFRKKKEINEAMKRIEGICITIKSKEWKQSVDKIVIVYLAMERKDWQTMIRS